MTCGIYVITERATGRMYVGLSQGIEGRWNRHKKRFSEDSFTYEILLPCPPETTREELSNLEKFYIKELDCMEPKGFNKTSGGIGRTGFSAEVKKKISDSAKSRIRSEEHKKNLSESHKGMKLSEETKKKISESLTGKICSEETKKKQSESHKGKIHSEETKKKQSESVKAYWNNRRNNVISH